MYFVEIRPTVKRYGPPRLVPLDTVDNFTGFRSVYAFPPSSVSRIQEANSTKFMQGLVVYSDTLFMDFDDYEPTEFRQWLKDQGIAYTEWDSGNRSVHFHIEIEPMEGPDVPASQRAWVKEHAPNADVSFYHATGLYRLPRTFHYKNPGHCKTLVDMNPGHRLVIPMAERSELSYQVGELCPQEEFFIQLTAKQRSGNRRPHLWLLATMAAESGIPYDDAVEYLRWHNSRFANPSHDDSVIVSQATSAYKRISQKYSVG